MPKTSTVSSAKRGAAERAGVHAWLPYYAGFSSDFVSDIIDNFGLTGDSLLLDPMNGSGTTTTVASRRGIPAIGIDANPAMTAIARAKDAVFADPMKAEAKARAVVESLPSRIPRLALSPETEPWFTRGVFSTLKALDHAIPRGGKQRFKSDPRMAAAAAKIVQEPGGLSWSDFLQAALIITARRSSSARTSKNPTWVKPGDPARYTRVKVAERFVSTAGRMAEDLLAEFGAVTDSTSTSIVEADARELPRAAIADGIITSPPYLTRIDYAVSTAPELVFLGYDSQEKFRSIRTAIMGSTCIVGGDYTHMEYWGKSCLRLLASVEGHASKASATYYLKQFVQYFRDAWSILESSVLLLRSGGEAAFVVQDSWYKDVHVPLGTIYVEMAQSLGVEAKLLLSEEVRAHMGLVNTRARAYSKGAIHEHIVHIRKP